MATFFPNKAGQYSVQFSLGGVRKTFYIGRVSMREAEEFSLRLSLLVEFAECKRPPDAATQRWLAELRPNHAAKLAALGLAAERGPSTLAELCDFCTARANVEPNSLVKYHDATASLVAFFGADQPYHLITEHHAEAFRNWLLSPAARRKGGGPLAETTAKKRLEQCSLYFTAAIDRGWLVSSPFRKLSIVAGDTSERMHYVTLAEVDAIMAAARYDMRLMIAFARFGGLRIPSEIWPLRWDRVDWTAGTIRVFSPKQRRRENKRWRTIPLFPEIRQLLEQCRQDDGPIFKRPDITATALRNRVERLCIKCGIVPWPKIWQNMRSTRETELLDQGYPIHVVCQWIGNSPAIALKHYTQVAKEHVTRAVAGQCSEMQLISASEPNTADNLTAPPPANQRHGGARRQPKPR